MLVSVTSVKIVLLPS